MIYCAQFMMKEVRDMFRKNDGRRCMWNAYLPGMFRGRAFGWFAMRL